MATNMALKRGRKAQRRKQVVAQKRRVEAQEASLPARVLRAARSPIRHCFLTESLFDDGMGTLVLARGVTPHYLELSSFLLDTFCLGIKDVMFRSLEGETFEMYMSAADAASPLVSVNPGYARKLLRDLASWSQSIGFAPHQRRERRVHQGIDAAYRASEHFSGWRVDGRIGRHQRGPG